MPSTDTALTSSIPRICGAFEASCSLFRGQQTGLLRQ
jgi:hypothetical protein